MSIWWNVGKKLQMIKINLVNSIKILGSKTYYSEGYVLCCLAAEMVLKSVVPGSNPEGLSQLL